MQNDNKPKKKRRERLQITGKPVEKIVSQICNEYKNNYDFDIHSICDAYGVNYLTFMNWCRKNKKLQKLYDEAKAARLNRKKSVLIHDALKGLGKNLKDRVVEDIKETIVERDGKKTKIYEVNKRTIPLSQKAVEFSLTNLMPDTFRRTDAIASQESKTLEQMSVRDLEALKEELIKKGKENPDEIEMPDE